MENPELLKLMKEKAESVEAFVSSVKGFDDIVQYATDLTKKQGGETVVATGLTSEEFGVLKTQCKDTGLTLLKPPFREHANNIHTSLTVVDWGIAETGSLVLDSSSEDIRIATMLVETHVAVLPSSRIKPDSQSLEKELNSSFKTDSPSYTAFITGASRTADIERVLAIGVHGPQELHILIMEENKA